MLEHSIDDPRRGQATHPHEHTTHQLRDVIEALPRYEPDTWGAMIEVDKYQADNSYGRWLKLSDVRAVVHKAATLGAPVAHDPHYDIPHRCPEDCPPWDFDKFPVVADTPKSATSK